MWESLATSRRQDRVLHGVAKLLNVVAGALIFPVWLVGQWLAGPLRRLLRRFDPGPDELTVPPARALDGRADARPGGDSASPASVADGRASQGAARLGPVRPRPAPPHRGVGILVPEPVPARLLRG